MTTAQLGSYTFDRVTYDDANDVLYLGDGVAGEETDLGHMFMYPDDTSREVVGAVLEAPRQDLEQRGALLVTLPDGRRVDASTLARFCR
ncbi:hypothetical protein [Capillimicrobium parvum]|uniref:Uncharacterized protein n=1 Tax=Capillimicrobium parvum TaxID=2884022 RepID=A0A9E7BZF3_9ACTN|nr:hypothetical protein [Capillimicrobium parvum]UGS35251.1 hypothetical protein DSM104329_01637 [Capillimicrobium parvum]